MPHVRTSPHLFLPEAHPLPSSGLRVLGLDLCEQQPLLPRPLVHQPVHIIQLPGVVLAVDVNNQLADRLALRCVLAATAKRYFETGSAENGKGLPRRRTGWDCQAEQEGMAKAGRTCRLKQGFQASSLNGERPDRMSCVVGLCAPVRSGGSRWMSV